MVALGLVGASCLVFPVVYLLLNDISLTAVANESLSYRYFYSLRLLEGGGRGIVLPQGQILTEFHHLLHLTILPLVDQASSSLWLKLEVFGYATLIATALIGIWLVTLISSSRTISREVKFLLTLLVVSSAYGSRSGISAFATPDYYSLEALFTAFSVYLFARLSHGAGDINAVRAACYLGAFSSVAGAIKISLLPTSLFPLVALAVNASYAPVLLVRMLAGFGATALAISAFIIASFYAFDASSAVASIRLWAQFVGNPGSEPMFWSNFLGAWRLPSTSSTGYGYALIIIPLSIGVQCAAFAFATGRRNGAADRILIAVVMATSAINLFFVTHRPAGTTLWETSLHLAAAAVVALIVIERQHGFRKVLLCFAGGLTALTSYSAAANFPKILDIERFKRSSSVVREVHQNVRIHDRILVIIPDNDHTTGTVEEGLMKGVSDFPTWSITTGQQVLDRLAPNVAFARDDATLKSDTAAMWIDIEGGSALTDTQRNLANRLTSSQSACRNWHIETWAWRARSITICPAPTSR